MEALKLQNKLNDDIESFESCITSFLKLRNVVSIWLDDVKRDNVFADVLLSHLYRWLSSGEAKLYDPQLYKFVNDLMQKCFTELIKKFKALGAVIVFTSFNRIIIETKKPDIKQARNYVNFIIDSIMKESMFKYLRMNTVEEWKILLFKDRFNYGGIRESSDGRVYCNFDLKNHLPEKVSKIFVTLIGEFILKNYQHVQEMRTKVLHDDPSAHVNMQLTNLSKEHGQDKDEEDPYVGRYGACASMGHLDQIQDLAELEDIQFAKMLIKKEFTSRLFEIIDEIQTNKSVAEHQFAEAEKEAEYITEEEYNEMKEERDAWNFRPQLGSYLESTKPALEFIKSICRIFSLEESLENTVVVMKRGCLKKLNMGEFENESFYYEPSLELILPQVTCSQCQASRNLDICKEYREERKGWICDDCDTLFNSAYIEKKLIDLMNSRLIAYQIQDLECTKCKMIKNTILSTLCSCTGRFKNTHCDISLNKLQNKNLLNEHSDIKILLKLLRNIARIQGMKLLSSVAESKLRVV